MDFDDDDYYSLMPAEKSPSMNEGSKLKRLKKAKELKKSETLDCELRDFIDVADGETESDSIDRREDEGCRREVKRALGFDDMEGADSELGFENERKDMSPVGFDHELEEKKKLKKKRVIDLSEMDELLLGSPESGFGVCSDDGENKDNSIDDLLADGNKRRCKMTSDSGFDSGGEVFDEMRDEIVSGDEEGGAYSKLGLVDGKKRPNVEEFDDELEEHVLKRMKKRAKDADEIAKKSKRKEKNVLSEVNTQFVEYQRSMRERTDVSFKPVPLARKPISTLLEKIRMRKQEISNSRRQNDRLRELTADDAYDDIPSVELSDRRCKDSGAKGLMPQPHHEDVTAVLSPVDPSDAELLRANNPHSNTQQLSIDKPSDAFRAPVSDTQDLFNDSPTEETEDDKSSEERGEAMEEDLTPSLLAVNLKLDYALPDDCSSSDEEDLDEENIDLLKSHPSGDPVREFLDEEAEEENDSDDDPLRFEDKEDDDVDAHELDDIVATDYNEQISDHEKRNELHQMWLQQQDEVGTENLLQKLRYGSNQKEAFLFPEDENGEKKTDSPVDESEDEDPTPNVKRMSTKILQKLIPQLYTDKDEYVSSDDEETEKILHKQRLIENVEHEAKDGFVSLLECETSREVFGRIKKLNVLPEAKKKANTSFFDMLLTKGISGDSVKYSFRSRASKNSVSSINKHRSSSARSYIFGRDDSGSRSSAAESAETLDNHEHKIKQNFPAKFMSSEATLNSQRTQIASSQTTAGTSLFEILRSSSIQARCSTSNSTVSCDAAFAAFKSVKGSMRLHGRS